MRVSRGVYDHPSMGDSLDQRRTKYVAGGAAIAIASLGAIVWGGPLGYGIAAAGTVLGALFAHSGIELRRTGAALPVYTQLVAAMGEGRLDDAAMMIAAFYAEPVAQEPLVRRVLSTVHAALSTARGDFEEARESASEAIAIPRRRDRVWDDVLQLEARSHRALANAVLGGPVADDVEAIDKASNAVSSLLARAVLASAVVLARSEQKKELGEHLAKNATLVLEHAQPAERALFRALRGYARAASIAVYREPPRAAGDGTIRAWIGKIVPAALPFAPSEHTGANEAAETPIVDDARSAQVRMWRVGSIAGKRRSLRPIAVALASLLAMLYLPLEVGAGTVLLGVLLFAVYTYLRAYGAGDQTAILAAERDIALGRTATASKVLRRVARRGSSLGAAAGHRLAVLANREGAFETTLEEVEAALALCKQPGVLEATSSFVIPGLLTENAVALAALQRFDEAEGELETLQQGFPGYALIASARFRVRLLIAVARGDQEAAAAIAATRTPHLALDLGTDLLADHALGDRSFEADLDATPMAAAWLRKFAR